MKLSLSKLGVIFLVIGLTICCTSAWGTDWREFAEASTGIFHYDAASVSSTPEGFVRVWIHNESKRETNLVEFNCKEASYHVLDVVQYDEADRIKSRETYYDNPTHTWYGIIEKSVPQPLYGILCP